MDVRAIVDRQRDFVFSGKPKETGFRKEQLKKLKSVLQSNEEALFAAIRTDMRKSEFEAYATELGLVYSEIDEAVKMIDRWARPRRVRTGIVNFPARSTIHPEPLGVTLIIGAWNYPYQLTLAPLVAAMAAGNTAVVKPSELPANASAALGRIVNEHFDPQYLAVVEGGVGVTTELLACRFDKIFFTGSTQVGRIVARAAAEYLTPVALELGGKSPCIVMADADLKVAARRIAWGKYLNAGQTCIAPDYVLAEQPIYETLLAELKAQIPAIAGADPMNSDSFIRIINGRNLQRLKRLIDPEKIYAGGTVVEEENYIEPTILRDVGFDDPIMQEEIFGPLMPVIPFSDLASVVGEIKRRPKPLSLYLFTSSGETQSRILDQVSFGGGCVNDVIMHVTNPHLPFGGVGDSGMGSYHSVAGFDAFSHFKSVLNKPVWFEAPFKYAPYSPMKLKVMRRLFGG